MKIRKEVNEIKTRKATLKSRTIFLKIKLTNLQLKGEKKR